MWHIQPGDTHRLLWGSENNSLNLSPEGLKFPRLAAELTLASEIKPALWETVSRWPQVASVTLAIGSPSVSVSPLSVVTVRNALSHNFYLGGSPCP